MDHTFANICLLKYAYNKGIALELIDENTHAFLVDEFCEISKDDFKYVSLFPFGDNVGGITLSGFKYPLNNAKLSMDYPLGISNEITDNIGTIKIENGVLIVMMVKE